MSTLRRWVLVAGLVAAAPVQAALHYQWDDEFTDADRARLATWLDGTYGALEKLVGKLPFDVQVSVHRRAHAGEPVPWAHTERDDGAGVVFYVDPAYSLDELRADWTAPHELSHLALPWLGEDNGWFAEGYASFMQYQVMRETGVLSQAQVEQNYREHLDRNRRNYPFPQLPLAQAAPKLRAKREYAVMYWGGAVYFMRADARLRARGTSLIAVLKRYVACCRNDDDDLDEVAAALDRAAKGKVFTPLLKEFRTEPGFPRLDAAP